MSAGFVKLLGDLWYGRGAFAPLAAAPRWRVLLVESTVLALVCGGFYLLRYEASAQRYRRALKQTAEQLQSVTLELEAEHRELDAARDRRRVLGGFMLDKDSRARLLSELTAASSHPGLVFQSVSPQPEEPIGEHVQWRTVVTLSGDFDALLGFLRWLERSGSPCSVLKVDVESRWEAEKPERFSLLLETYSEADPTEMPTEPGR